MSLSLGPSQPVAPAAPRRRGRPRDASADDRILAAAAELILTRGFDNMTVDEVAAKARAGKATVYRRWAGKEDLAFAALEQLYSTQLPVPDTGSLYGDLLETVRQALEFAGSDVGRKYIRMTVSESLRDPRIGALYTSAFEGQEAAARELFQRGIDRGELRPDFRMDLAVNWLVGLVILYSIIERQIPSPDEAESLVAFMLEGIGARAEG